MLYLDIFQNLNTTVDSLLVRTNKGFAFIRVSFFIFEQEFTLVNEKFSNLISPSC